MRQEWLRVLLGLEQILAAGVSRVFSARTLSAEHMSPSSLVRGRIRTDKPNLSQLSVPSGSIDRGMQIGGIALNMVFARGKEQRLGKLVEGLCRLRGAALKVGQLISLLPDHDRGISEILKRVRDSAYRMPDQQVDFIMKESFGENWRQRFEMFDDLPIAAASIGQVHQGILKDGRLVAVKIQYPGVAESIDSDLANLGRMLKLAGMVPKGLYLDNILRVVRDELRVECDYEQEAMKQLMFKRMFENERDVYVPDVIQELSSKKVLTSELVGGSHIDQTANLSQEERNKIALTVLKICLKELFQFKFMQTDPNWSNFMYDKELRVLNLIDFGASRSYPEEFVSEYFKMVKACANKDRNQVIDSSLKLGLLSGKESELMLETHIKSAYIVGEPFSTEEPYDFGASKLTDRLSELALIMLKHRVAAPPTEVYSLHRKLSGAYFTCIKLNAKISCRKFLFNEDYEQ